LLATAIAGNDPNVGRLLAAVGKHIGHLNANSSSQTRVLGGGGGVWNNFNPERLRLVMGDREIFSGGRFRLDPDTEIYLQEYMERQMLYSYKETKEGGKEGGREYDFSPRVTHPRHERCVDLEVHCGCGDEGAVILGGDLTYGYIQEDADYRS